MPDRAGADGDVRFRPARALDFGTSGALAIRRDPALRAGNPVLRIATMVTSARRAIEKQRRDA
jgi:hypothetical protein